MCRPATASPAVPLPAVEDTPAKALSVEQRAQSQAMPVAAAQVKGQMDGSSPLAAEISPGMAEVQAALAKRRRELTLQAFTSGKAVCRNGMELHQIRFELSQ